MDKKIPYRQNTESRKKLIETAKQLFYEQGYAATTLAQISDLSGINNGLITYYFASKANLASEIYTAFVLELRNEIAKQLYNVKKDYKLELGIGIETRILLAIKFENSNIRRFRIEYSRERSKYTEVNEKRQHYYQLQKRLINPSISDIDLCLYEVCGIAIVEAMAEAYTTKLYSYDPTYIEDYALRLLYGMLQLPEYQIETLIDETRFLQDKLKIKVGYAFKLITE